MIDPKDLERILRGFGGPLEHCTVRQHLLAGHIFIFEGMCSLRGQPHKYEAEFDAYGLRSMTDIEALVRQLLDNLQQAEAQA